MLQIADFNVTSGSFYCRNSALATKSAKMAFTLRTTRIKIPSVRSFGKHFGRFCGHALRTTELCLSYACTRNTGVISSQFLSTHKSKTLGKCYIFRGLAFRILT